MQESDQQVSHPLFAALAGASGEPPLNVEVQIDELRKQAQNQSEQAKRLSVPAKWTRRSATSLLVLNLRAEALAKIASARAHRAGGAEQAGGHPNRGCDGDASWPPT